MPFDPSYIIRHPVFLVTFIIAIPAWLIAFITQCVAEARYDTGSVPVVRFLWFNIWIQLACIIHLASAIGTNSLGIHRFQLAIVLAIATVFAVFGVEYIFSPLGALKGVGVAWLLLTLVDLVWILYLTSEEDSPFYRIFTAGGNGGLSGYNRRRAHSEAGYEAPRQNTYNNGGFGGYAPPPNDMTPQKAPREEVAAAPSTPVVEQKPKARAMYAYSADPSDSNEVSFNKGDILEVLDNTGKWFQVRTPSGQVGIAPSNYVTMI